MTVSMNKLKEPHKVLERFPCSPFVMPVADSKSNDTTHSLYRSLYIVRVINSRRLRWVRHVARMEEGKNAFKIVTGTPTGKRPLSMG